MIKWKRLDSKTIVGIDGKKYLYKIVSGILVRPAFPQHKPKPKYTMYVKYQSDFKAVGLSNTISAAKKFLIDARPELNPKGFFLCSAESLKYNKNHYHNAYYIVSKKTGKVVTGPFSRPEGDDVLGEMYNHKSYQLIEGRWLTDIAFPGKKKYMRNAGRKLPPRPDRFWKSFTYGTLPTKRQFMAHYKRELGEDGLYQMHLRGDADCGAAEDTVFQDAIEAESHFDSDDVWEGLKQLKKKWEDGDDHAGDLASGILYTLEFEWV